MFLRFLLGIATAMTLLACQNTPAEPEQDAQSFAAPPENFQALRKARLNTVHLDPTADLGRYTAILLPPLDVAHVEVRQPSNQLSRTRDWQLTEDDKTELQSAFHEAMLERFSADSGFAISDSAGDGVMELQVQLAEIAPAGPKDDFESRPAGRSSVYSEGFGTMTIKLEFRDSVSGELLATAEDKARRENVWRLNNSVSNRAEIQRRLKTWAGKIHSTLNLMTSAEQAGIATDYSP